MCHPAPGRRVGRTSCTARPPAPPQQRRLRPTIPGAISASPFSETHRHGPSARTRSRAGAHRSSRTRSCSARSWPGAAGAAPPPRRPCPAPPPAPPGAPHTPLGARLHRPRHPARRPAPAPRRRPQARPGRVLGRPGRTRTGVDSPGGDREAVEARGVDREAVEAGGWIGSGAAFDDSDSEAGSPVPDRGTPQGVLLSTRTCSNLPGTGGVLGTCSGGVGVQYTVYPPLPSSPSSARLQCQGGCVTSPSPTPSAPAPAGFWVVVR